MNKLRYRIKSVPPPALFTFLTDSGYNIDRMSRYPNHDNCSGRSVYKTVGSLSCSNMQTGMLLIRSVITSTTRSFSSMAGTILVQAWDPAKLSVEIENAIDERRYDDTWKLFEQHMQDGRVSSKKYCQRASQRALRLSGLRRLTDWWSKLLRKGGPSQKEYASLIAMKPDTNSYNIALAGCLLFETTRKAEQLLDMMPRIAVKADVNLLIIMAHIYERNGHREELRKLQRHIDEVYNLSDIQFRQFYNCLLSCHLKFGDLDSASKMVLEMIQKAKEARNSLAASTFAFDVTGNYNMSSSGPELHIREGWIFRSSK
ncbi:hypothetical protein QYF36_011278 [Acer negundo]|nr:hypothetical protein QYF36_011278 [Acer negundo]